MILWRRRGAIVLLVVASGFAYTGKRLRAPLGVTQPGVT
jgi:hypothetical protein